MNDYDKAHGGGVTTKAIGGGGKLMTPQGRDSSSLKVENNQQLVAKIGGGVNNLSDTLGHGNKGGKG